MVFARKIRGFLGDQPNAKMSPPITRQRFTVVNGEMADAIGPRVLRSVGIGMAVLLFCARQCFGCIGDSLPQLEARYGKGHHLSVSPDDESAGYTFAFKDYYIDVGVIKGRSLVEGLAHTNDSIRLSDAECVGCAQALTGATNWIKDTTNSTDAVSFWRSGDFVAERINRTIPKSSHFPESFRSTLRVEGKDYRDHVKRLNETRAAAEVKSFADKFNATSTNSPPRN